MASAKNTKASKKEEVQLELIYSDETQFKYWESHLFNDVYLRKDLPVKHKDVWDFEEDLGFQNFMNTLRDLAVEYDGREKELQNWSETETINNWIKHVLNALGWADNCTGVQNPFLEETSFRYDDKTYRTDILIVDLPKEKQYINKAKGDDKLVQARDAVLIPVEAKYWNRLEEYRQGQGEEKKRVDAQGDDTSKTMTPNEQTIKYMEILKKDWGVLTDGARWRLFNREISSEDSQRYYEFNLESLIESLLTEETEHDRQEVMEAAKYFYFFFSKTAIFPEDESEQPLVDEVLSFSKKYVNKVEEDLKDRFVKAMNFACNGFFRESKKRKEAIDLNIIRNVSESALFNILFTKSLESRNVLPMNSDGYRKLSLSSIVDKIERFDPEKDIEINLRNLERTFKKSNGSSFAYKAEGTELHDKIVKLTKIIHDGKSKKDDFGFEIAGFRESIFTDDEWDYFKKCKLTNDSWVNILFQLGYADSETRNRKYQQIPYSFFTPRQLGSIYESFLEFQLDNAPFDMAFDNKQWKKVDLNSRKYKLKDIPKVKKGELFFTPDNKDRKATGSYYTPDFVVQYLIQNTLGPLTKGKNASQILKIRVIDPAMGSGHFLVGALNYLTKRYLDLLADESEGDLKITLPEAKREVLDSCIFGVDINERAVKLAKMSLWLESAYINKKLERLDDQLVGGNTLGAGRIWPKKYNVKTDNSFDAVLGNPPYIFTRDKKITEEEKDYYKERFKWSRFKANTYQFFVERSFEMLKPGGFLGFIIPNNWLTVDTSDIFRKKVIEASESGIIINCKEKIFEDASVDNSIIVFKKGERLIESSNIVLIEYEDKKFNEIISTTLTATEDPIRFSSSKTLEILDTVRENSIQLSDIFQVKTGMQCYEVGKGTPKQTAKMRDERVYHHKKRVNKSCRKYLLGKDVCRYNMKWSGDYVEYGKNLSAPRDPHIFSVPRVLVRQIPNKPPLCIHACFVNSEHVNDINSMVIPVGNVDDAYYCMAVLNSKIVSQWFDIYFDKFQRKTFPQIKVKELSQFPFPKNINSSDKNEVIKLAKKIEQFYIDETPEKAEKYENKLEDILFSAFGFNMSKNKASA